MHKCCSILLFNYHNLSKMAKEILLMLISKIAIY